MIFLALVLASLLGLTSAFRNGISYRPPNTLSRSLSFPQRHRGLYVYSQGGKISPNIAELLFSPAKGQLDEMRMELHASGAQRSLSDSMMFTHVGFAMVSYAAFTHGLNDLCLLNLVTGGLSYQYHLWYERPGTLTVLEGLSAKLLFVYGFLQTLTNCPSFSLKIVELLLLGVVMGSFLLTNIYKETLYEKFHPWALHLIPTILGLVVATYHTPILF